MCLIAVHDAASPLLDSEVEDIFYANQDGMGAMWAHAGQIHIHKCLPTSAEEAIEEYKRINEYVGSGTIVWHWRYATHGATNLEMCHPFRMRKDAAVVHNGVIAGYGNKSQSDTADFVKQHLAKRKDSDIVWELIEHKTRGSRLCFLTATPDGGAEIRYLGSWEQHGNAFVSNMSWKSWPKSTPAWRTKLWADPFESDPTDEEIFELMALTEDAMRLGMSKREAVEYASFFSEHPESHQALLEEIYDIE